MTNTELAATFSKIADLLQIKGEVIYKILAYRKAAESLTDLGRETRAVWEEGGIPALVEIPGVGKAIAEKIDELLTTGELEFLNKLTAEIPATLADLMPVPDLGPKKIKLFYDELDIRTLDQLEEAAQTGKLRDLPGMGEKSEAKILAGIASLKRRKETGDRIPLERAWPFAQAQLEFLRGLPGVTAVETAGSLRRMRETVGDLDLLAAAADSGPVMEAFTTQPNVARVLGKGPTKSSVEYTNGMRAQVWVHPPERFGTALQYATGSKDHSVKVRELSLDQGLSLSEHALTDTEIGEEILCATEAEVYEKLGLQWVPPEMREDRGEVALAKAGKLPRLVEIGDVVSSLHNHSNYSDGQATMREMAEAAIARGVKVLAITDHSYSLGIVQGVRAEDLLRQREEMDALQKDFGKKIRLLLGVELEIRADGTLDFEDDVLATLDIVVASLHVSLRQPREQITERLLNAIRNPHVDVIGHPTSRQIPDRDPADLDMDAVFAAAKEHDVALELNANPRRLDLKDVYVRRAMELGVKLSINTDAHHPDHFDLLHFGVATARRGWATPEAVINCWEPEKLFNWLGRPA
ncbi:MAG TPA: DNA polymerase/3'-5' exonuclease PolX [Anaerolineales bacterium]|nr:DNA polymerase/3'-5' exonuclease PolX [Anaerolineales bacterium]